MDHWKFAPTSGKYDPTLNYICEVYLFMNKDRNIIYSTDPNWEKNDPIPNKQPSKSGSQTAYIERDRKKRAGKVVTVVSNLSGDLKSLQKELQRHCGSGGTLKNGKIEIQGDHREKVAVYLGRKGFNTKFKGG